MPERRVYLVRHAIAEEVAKSGRDDDRELTPDGRKKMARAAKGLVALGVEVDLLVSSPLVRAVQTADEIAEKLPKVRRDVWPELANGGDERALAARVEETSGANVMLVGHEPDLGRTLSYWLTGRPDDFATYVRKGSVACLLAGGLPPHGRATLEWFSTARQLGLVRD